MDFVIPKNQTPIRTKHEGKAVQQLEAYLRNRALGSGGESGGGVLEGPRGPKKGLVELIAQKRKLVSAQTGRRASAGEKGVGSQYPAQD